MKTSLLILISSFALLSCKGEMDLKSLSKELPVQTATGNGNSDGIDTTLVFAGVTSSTHTDSTMTLNWTAHANAIAYDVFEIVSGVAILKQTAVGQMTTSTVLTGLTPGDTYTFRVRIRTNTGKSDSNVVDETSTLTAAPSAPTLLTKLLPGSASSPTGIVKIQVSGVKAGDTVKLYSDSGCTNEVASAQATASTIELATTNLPLGAHTFAATATNAFTTVSACSSATVAFTRSCPSLYGDFVLVGSNNTVGTPENFCVMKYEARNYNGKPYSSSAGLPINAINLSNAKNGCEALGTGYKLITNPEWMSIAREIEARASNWSNNIVGDAFINRGWSAASWASEGFGNTTLAPSSLDNCMYNTASDTCAATGSFDLKRTHDLANGYTIWDFSGNLQEWVDWSVTCDGSSCAKAYASADGSPVDDFYELLDLDTNYGTGHPINVNTFPPLGPYNSSHNMGTYNARSGNSHPAVIRGGTFNYGTIAGIYALEFTDPTNAWAQFGVRCTYTP